jgi:hypothetical protein
VFQATALDGQLAGLQKELGGQRQAALCQENSLLALQTALATAEKKAALEVGGVVDIQKWLRKDQCCGSGSSISSESGSGSPGFDRQSLKKNSAGKCFVLFLIKKYNILTPRPP